MRRFLDLCRFETKQGTRNDGAGILDGWIAFILVWAAVIAPLLAIVGALLNREIITQSRLTGDHSGPEVDLQEIGVWRRLARKTSNSETIDGRAFPVS